VRTLTDIPLRHLPCAPDISPSLFMIFNITAEQASFQDMQEINLLTKSMFPRGNAMIDGIRNNANSPS